MLRLDEFRLSQKEEDNGFSDIAYTHRLVVLSEDEHFAVEPTVDAPRMKFGTEDDNTSLRENAGYLIVPSLRAPRNVRARFSSYFGWAGLRLLTITLPDE